MRTTFYELIREFAENNGCEFSMKEGTCQGSLTAEGLILQLGLEERTGMIFVQTGVGLIPQSADDSEKMQFFRMLLDANNLYSGSGGCTLGTDSGMDLVTLQLSWDISHLDQEGFASIIGNFLNAAAEWMVKLDQWVPEASGSSEDIGSVSSEIPPFSYLKV